MKKVSIKLALVLLVCSLMMTIVGCEYVDQIKDYLGLGEPHVHQYTEEITKAPTCTEAGVKTFTCSCNDSYTEPIEKTSHSESIISAVAPTCTESGLTEGKKCSVCGTVITAQNTVPATGHKYDDNYDATCNNDGCDFVREADCRHSNTEVLSAVAPTCTATGLTEGLKCTDCGETLVAQETVKALGHSETTLAAVAPTCTETGLTEGKQCTVCHTVTVPQQTVNAKGHSETTLAAVAPTCTETGLTEGKQCTVCHTVTVPQQTVNAKGHSETTLAAVAPTCTETGLTEGKQCTVCNTITVAQTTVAALGHTEKTLAAVAPTCTETGLTEGKQCSVCNETLVEQETVDALGHTAKTLAAVAPTCTETGLTEGKQCSICDKVLLAQQTVAALGHKWNDATCTSPKTCSVCKETEGKANGHTEDVAKVENEIKADCTNKGSYDSVVYCAVCHEELSRETIITNALGHEMSDWLVFVAPTYEKEGREIRTCLRIGCDHTESRVIPMLTHTFGDWTVKTAPTCTTEGVETRKCLDDDCDVVEERAIKANGHTHGLAATCTAPQECTVCHAILAPAKGHTKLDAIIENSVPATCTKAGSYDTVVNCSVCQGEVSRVTTTVPVIPHTPGAAATCTTHQECTVCHTELAPAKGHTEGDWIVDKAASCTEEGHKHQICSVCRVTIEESAIEVVPHIPGAAATCTTAQTCKNCSYEFAPAKNHSYGDWTAKNDGTHYRVCSNDASHVESESCSYNSSATAPTCTADGYTTYVCSDCGHTYVVVDEGSMKDHTYDNACDVNCNACGEGRVPADHVYDNACDAACNECQAEREVPDHVYDNACDAACNECQAEREVPGHVYDNACDTACNECQAEREVPGHVYDNACDTACNECQAEREVPGHVYDNACDAACNECQTEREVPGHVYDNACDAACNECQAERTPDDHVYDDDFDTTCNVCGDTRIVAPALINNEVVKEHDLFDLENKETLVIDFAQNVKNVSNLALVYSVKCSEDELVLDGSVYTFVFEEYNENVVYSTFVVTVYYTVNGEECKLEYTYKLGLKNTSAYRVANGNFENGLDGWTFNNTLGDAPFAGIDEKDKYWAQEFPMFNVGKYFSSYADGASEASQGTLASPYFIVNSDYATYMLAGAGNHNVYITIENKNGEVLALYRNTKFADLPAGLDDWNEQRELIGNTVFLCNFVTYKVDLTDFAGQEIRFVIHDYASEGWGVVFFDELNTYYTSEDAIPENAVLAENLLANKSALAAELALEVAEQGDYTLDSYNAYLEKLDHAKALVNDIAVTQATVNEAVEALNEARLALEVRPVEEVADANKSFSLISDNSKEIILADFINTNGLSNITYDVQSDSAYVTLSAISDGKFTITAGKVSEATEAIVSIIVYYDGVEKLTVDLTVQITNDLAPSVFNEEVVREYDVYNLDNKTDITLKLAENVDNPGKLDLTYSVNGVVINGSDYTFTFGTYTDKAASETFIVVVSYVANGVEQTISYTYKLVLKDSTAYRLVNGDFENGMEGWTKLGNIGDVSTNRSYWNGEFGMDGEKMFSAYEPVDLEKNIGTLTSSTFKVGGSGFVTFKIGGMRDQNYVYVDVVDASTKEILARYYNGLWKENETHCTLVAYKADLSEFAGREVFFRLSDNADSGYGLFFADSFITYYENEPEGFNDATRVTYTLPNTIYDLFNGGFEMGNVQGWWSIGEIGVVTNANGYWGDNIPYEKVGDFLFTGVESNGADTMREGNRGTLTSSMFEIGGTGMISFKLGGGGSEQCYVQVIDAVTGEVLVRYRQQAQQDAKLIQYVADLSAYIGRTARIQVVDYASSGWGCVSFDNVVTYYPEGAALPEGHTANNIFHGSYEVKNGSFENGLDGWYMNIWESGAHNTLGWVESSEHDAGWYTKNDGRKDGNNLFTFCRPDGTNCENTKGELNSSVFTLKKGTYVSFRFGGAGTREVRVELVRADGTVIATFYNEAPGKVNTEMHAYYYQYTGETADCFFRVVDNSTSNYGCFVVDDFRANLESAPEGFIAAIQ